MSRNPFPIAPLFVLVITIGMVGCNKPLDEIPVDQLPFAHEKTGDIVYSLEGVDFRFPATIDFNGVTWQRHKPAEYFHMQGSDLAAFIYMYQHDGDDLKVDLRHSNRGYERTLYEGYQDGEYWLRHGKEKYEATGGWWKLSTWDQGHLRGPFEQYHASGSLDESGEYYAGMLTGIHRRHRADGSIAEEWEEDDGETVWSKQYDLEGNVIESTGDPPANTLSIVAYDPATGDLGIAVASKVLGVGVIVPWGKSGVGAIATQAHANTAFGPAALQLLKTKSAREAVDALIAADPGRDLRQLGIVDAQGNVASYTGAACDDWAGQIEGENFAVQGNLLTGEAVLQQMAASYRTASQSGEGELADWLTAALSAGVAAGGDKRGKQSAALMVYRAGAGYGGNDRYIDLRVDDHPQPEQELARLLEVHKQFFAHAHRRPAE